MDCSLPLRHIFEALVESQTPCSHGNGHKQRFLRRWMPPCQVTMGDPGRVESTCSDVDLGLGFVAMVRTFRASETSDRLVGGCGHLVQGKGGVECGGAVFLLCPKFSAAPARLHTEGTTTCVSFPRRRRMLLLQLCRRGRRALCHLAQCQPGAGPVHQRLRGRASSVFPSPSLGRPDPALCVWGFG